MKIFLCKYTFNGVDYVNLIRALTVRGAQRIFEASFSPQEKHPTFMLITEINDLFDYREREEMICV